jgi:hypothetical protein
MTTQSTAKKLLVWTVAIGAYFGLPAIVFAISPLGRMTEGVLGDLLGYRTGGQVFLLLLLAASVAILYRVAHWDWLNRP